MTLNPMRVVGGWGGGVRPRIHRDPPRVQEAAEADLITVETPNRWHYGLQGWCGRGFVSSHAGLTRSCDCEGVTCMGLIVVSYPEEVQSTVKCRRERAGGLDR
ncbi:hypothetical protein SRHO_G00171600 [Serrasalmus rhombeus]